VNKLLKILGWFWHPLRVNAAFFVFMFALGYVCTQTEIRLHLKGAKPYELSATELFFDLYVLCVVLSLLPRRIRFWLRGILTILLYAVALVDMFCYVHFESTLTPTMLMLFFETTSREAGEFLRSYVGWDLVTSKTGWILLIALLHVLWALFRAWWSRRQRAMGLRLSQPVVLWSQTVLGVAALSLFLYCAVECWPNKQAMARLMTLGSLGEVEHELTRKDCANLYLPIHRMAFSLRANRLASQQITRLIETTGKVQVDSCTFRSPQIVLIIGESYNKHRSQLYGYDKAVTPRQLQRMQDSTLVAFTDVVAPWNLTSFVFKYVFSLYAVGDEGDWTNQPMFPEVFRKAGYHVTFLTNQFLPKAGEAVYDFSGGFFLNHPELSNQFFDTRNRRLHRYDEGLLAEYDALEKQQHHDHQLTIFHLMGQHVDYQSRFPLRTRRKFTPADYPDKHLAPKRMQMNADYDNATLYNDSVVDEILRRFEQQNAIVIYMPDHAEGCFNVQDYYGRNHSAAIDYALAREEFEIPFWIWASESYRKTHPYGWEAIRRYRHRPYMTDLLPHTLLFLAGIHTKDYRRDRDVLNSDYNEQRPRLLKNSVDYDGLRPNE